MLHSDQGSQYTSHDWQTFLRSHEIECSMSRRGNCHDNAVAESFFQLLKRERVRRKIYLTREVGEVRRLRLHRAVLQRAPKARREWRSGTQRIRATVQTIWGLGCLENPGRFRKQIAEVTNGVTIFAHDDALGSPVARSNSDGVVLTRTKFEPYGLTAAGTKPSKATSVIGFTGHVQDPETDLVYMQQRYYDPIAGRFLSVDPIVTDTKTRNGFGRYAYAENNPLRYTDPDGMRCSGTGADAKCTVDLIDGKPFDRAKLTDAQKTQLGKIEAALTTAFKGALANAGTTFSLQHDAAGHKGEVTGKEIAGLLAKSNVDLSSKDPGNKRLAEAWFDRQYVPGMTFFSRNINNRNDHRLSAAAAHESIHLAREFRFMNFREGDGHNQWFDPAVRQLIKSSDGAKQ